MESIQSILSRHLPRIRNVRDELKHLNYSDNEIIGGVHHFVIQLKDLRNFPTDYIKQHVNALLNEEKGKSLPIGEQKYIKSASNLLNRRAKESKKTTTKKTQSRKTYKQNYDVKINNFSNNHKNNPLLDKNGELLLRAPMQVNPASRIKRPVYLKPNLETSQLDYFYIAKKIKTLKEEKKQIKKELKVEAEPKAKKELKQEIKHIDNIINNTIGNNEPISKINVEDAYIKKVLELYYNVLFIQKIMEKLVNRDKRLRQEYGTNEPISKSKDRTALRDEVVKISYEIDIVDKARRESHKLFQESVENYKTHMPQDPDKIYDYVEDHYPQLEEKAKQEVNKETQIPKTTKINNALEKKFNKDYIRLLETRLATKKAIERKEKPKSLKKYQEAIEHNEKKFSEYNKEELNELIKNYFSNDKIPQSLVEDELKQLGVDKIEIKKELKVETRPQAKEELKQEAKKIQIDKDIQEKFNKDMTRHIDLMLAERRSRNPERIKRYQDATKEIDERFSKFNEEEIRQLKKNYWAEEIRRVEEAEPKTQAKAERKKETKPKAKEELKQEVQDINNDEEPYIPYHIRSNDSKAKNYVKRIEDLVHQAWLKGSQIEGLQNENINYNISKGEDYSYYSNSRRRKNITVLKQFNRNDIKENNREIDKLKKEIPGAWELVNEAVNQYQEYINNTVKNPNPDEASLVAINHFANLQETFKRPTFTPIVPSKDEPYDNGIDYSKPMTFKKKRISTIL